MKKIVPKKLNICLITIFICCCSCTESTTTELKNTFEISNGGIDDHANAKIEGSIAWYLNKYGGGTKVRPHIFNLISPEIYNFKSRIILPENSELNGRDVDAVIQCDPKEWTGYGEQEFVWMNSGSKLFNIEVRCNWMPKTGILTSGNLIKIINVTVHKSSRTIDKSNLILLNKSSNVTISDCILRRGGCDNTETSFERRGYLIFINEGNNITINNNDMGVSSSAGIAFRKTSYLNIENNEIHDTGRAVIPGYLADGITSYHNGTGSTDRHVKITNNKIWDSRNHGIHVSGRGFTITGNKIWNSGITKAASNISIADHKSPADCSYDIIIKNNELVNCPIKNGPSIKRSHYKEPFILSDNTGCIEIYNGAICSQ